MYTPSLPPSLPVPRVDVLNLVGVVCAVVSSAMQDNPANRLFFETNVSVGH